MQVYLDNAATTPMAKEVIEAMTEVMNTTFGNPSSTHVFGRKAKGLLEQARRTVAQLMHCEPAELFFTSGGTEADNMALFSAVRTMGVRRIISSPIEHHAVGHTLDYLVKNDEAVVSYVNLDAHGKVDLIHLEELLADSSTKTLVSLMHANNEIATLLPLEKVSELCRKYGALFHSDTVQTVGHYPFNLKELDIDFITCSAHKFHGPKGVGFLYVNKKVHIENLIHGGGQERGFRGGTENVSGIVGLAKALELANDGIEEHQHYVQGLKSHMMNRFKNELKGVDFIGETNPDEALYTVLNVQFPASDASGMLLFTLDLKGVAASGGSACSSGATNGSHVLEGIHVDGSRPNVRFSFSRYTTLEEVDFAVEQLLAIYA